MLLLIARWISALVRGSPIGGLDRTLGLVFGLARGAALVIIAYIVGGMVVHVDRWPEPVLEARIDGVGLRGREVGWWTACRHDYRPAPLSRRRRAARPRRTRLLHATPQGRAVGTSRRFGH